MTAEVHAFTRPGGGARPPLVPPKVVLREDAIYLRFDPGLLDTRWYRSCTPEQALAGIALRARALKQEHAGSLPNDDGELAYLSDFGRDLTAWQGAKAKALEGWILCADDRWHHPDIARNVLHIWIGRLESRRIGAWGNISRAKDGGLYGLDSILDDLDEALDALRALDPQDAVLRKASEQQSKWWARLDQVLAGTAERRGDAVDDPEPNRMPNRHPNRIPPEGHPKVSEAKRSQDSSSPRRGDDSSVPDARPGREHEEPGGSVNRTAVPPWPPGWFEAFKARYPRREAWGRAEKALDRIRKAGKIPLEDLLAAVDRLVAEGRPRKFTPLAATWLNDRGWENEAVPPPEIDPPPRPGRPSRASVGVDSAVAGLAAVFRRRAPPSVPLGEAP